MGEDGGFVLDLELPTRHQAADARYVMGCCSAAFREKENTPSPPYSSF